MTSSFGANLSANISAGGAGASAGTSGSIGGAVGGAVAVAGAAVGIASAIGSLVPAMIMCVTSPLALGIVNLDFNPSKITMTRSASVDSNPRSGLGAGTPSGASPPIAKKVNAPDIKMDKIFLEGITCKMRCDQLLRWLSPVMSPPDLLKAAIGMPVASQPPQLMFIWGPPKVGFVYEVMLTQVTISYVRFNPIGIPVRAEVSLSMRQIPSLLSEMPTNPTSGGPAGRRTHVVRSGDTLQSIAMSYYGQPGQWRAIAAANRIDDPARVRPGTTVYLPLGDEVAAGASR